MKSPDGRSQQSSILFTLCVHTRAWVCRWRTLCPTSMDVGHEGPNRIPTHKPLRIECGTRLIAAPQHGVNPGPEARADCPRPWPGNYRNPLQNSCWKAVDRIKFTTRSDVFVIW